MKMIDTHVHIGLSFRDQAHGKPEDILAIMQATGIERSIVFAIDQNSEDGTYREANDEVIRLCRAHPDAFTGLCRLSPTAGKRAVRELERTTRAGLVGLKLHTKSDRFAAEDCHEILEAAESLKLPVLVHMEHLEGKNPQSWAPLFKKFSKTPFIMAHGSRDQYREAGRIASLLANVYIDTSVLSYRRTVVLLEAAGPDKILFASDYPYSHPAIELKKFDLILKDESTRRKVFYGNAEKIWGFAWR